MPPTIMGRGLIDLWTRTPQFIVLFSASAPSHHSLSSVAFTTNIAQSNFSVHTGVCRRNFQKLFPLFRLFLSSEQRDGGHQDRENSKLKL